jgi:hypothetical protein
MSKDGKPPKGKRPGGTPPVEHQFKPGQSGNPGGRPKKQPTMRDEMYDVLDTIVTIPIDGRPQKMTMRKALAYKTLAGAGSDVGDFVGLFGWLEGRTPPASAEPDESIGFDPAEDVEIYRKAIERGRQGRGEPDEEEDEDA